MFRNKINKEDVETFGDLLRYYRQTTFTRIDSISEKMNWKKSYLMDIEKGRVSPPSTNKILMLCDVLGLDAEQSTEFLEKAWENQTHITLDIPENNPKLKKVALLLARSDEIEEKEFKKEMYKILEGD